MMKGTKRFAASDSIPIANDSVSKRIMVGSTFDPQRAQPSQEQLATTPSLDMERAELSRQHVRALNNQFASWVKAQLENHPDELWEDGVQDYLNHASSIMEKFSDVVNWLKTNAAKGESFSFSGSNSSQVIVGREIKENDIKLFPDKPASAVTGSSTSFASSWSSGVFFNNKAPFSFGSQASAPGNNQLSASTKNDVSDSADGEDETEQPSSPSVKKTEEKGIIVVHEVKCKLYVKSSDPAEKDAWKDKGTGQLSIKCKEGVSKGSKESKPTIIIRNDVGKVLLNALIYPGIKTNMQKNSIVAIFHTVGDGDNSDSVVARTFLIRTKSEEDRNKLAAVIQEHAPAA